jgi:predicted extracellular nuclease
VIEPPPDPEVLTIMEIQGVGHLSDDEGVLVETSGVTTAVSRNGYWIQDPAGDVNAMTSDGLFVFAGTTGAKPVVGDVVTVTGTVDEFRPGSATGPSLNITELTDSEFVVGSSGNPLPAAVLIGPSGVQAPVDIIDNDSPTRIDIEVVPPASYDPAEDAIDFYEQYEGMRLQVNSPNVVGPTNNFGELVVLPRGANDYVRSVNRGVVYSGYDSPNPRRVILDDVLIGFGNMPDANTGDRVDGSVVGVLDYSFNNFKLLVTTPPTVADGGIVREITNEALSTELAVATFNVENLSPNDTPEKFAALAEIIVTNLAAPDIVTLEEVQDNNGAVNDAVVDADLTLTQLVAAIDAADPSIGPTYEWREIAPEDGQDGGQPGGNIRNAFLFRTDRGLAFVDRGAGDATTPTQVVPGADGGAELTLSPGRVDPTNIAWANSRKPLAGEFTWNGENLIVIAKHFASKGGDEPLFGRWQPPNRSSEVQRHLQAQVLNDFVDEVLAVDAEANVVVAGDINDFEFSETIDILTGEDAALADLVQYLRPRQRYTYVFDGNFQVLDHLLVSPSLAPAEPIAGAKPVKIRRDYVIVHVNADFSDQVSDHDPQVVRLRFGSATP